MTAALEFLKRADAVTTGGALTTQELETFALAVPVAGDTDAATGVLALLLVMRSYGAGSSYRVRERGADRGVSLTVGDSDHLAELLRSARASLARMPASSLSITPMRAEAAAAMAGPAVSYTCSRDRHEERADVESFDPSDVGSGLHVTLDRARGLLTLNFSPQVYAREYVQWFGRCAGNVLEQLVATTALTRGADLHLHSEAQLHTLAEELGYSVPPPVQWELLHEHIDEVAERAPDRIAVVFQNERLSFRQLVRCANGLANRLLARGQGGDGARCCVLVVMPPGLHAASILLGLAKSGCTYVPVQADTPAERIRFILSNTGARVVFAGPDTMAQLSGLRAEGVELIDVEALFRTRFDARPVLDRVQPNDVAYVIHTSGSTGEPKGVPITHGTLRNHIQAWVQVTPPPDPDRFSGIVGSSLGFDVSILEILSTLCLGGTLHVVSSRVLRDPQALARYLIDHAVTAACIRPSILDALADAFEREPDRFPLEQLFSGAESISTTTAARFKRLNERLDIVIGYGATETTIGGTYARLRESETLGVLPIGRPLPGYRFYILDERGAVAPFGAIGEIAVGGDTLSPGYLNRPDLTAQSFGPDRISGQPGARIYHTGDLGRFLPDGELLFCGRADTQVKIRGVRVELEEIELVLRKVSDASNVAVVTAGEGANKQVIAYLERPRKPRERIRQEVAALLPPVMRPAAFVVVESLPLNANMKIERRALPPPRYEDFGGGGYVAPREGIERFLADTLCTVLGIEQLGAEDDLLHFGLNSLQSIALADRLSRALDRPVELAGFATCRTVRELAVWFERSTPAVQAAATSHVSPA